MEIRAKVQNDKGFLLGATNNGDYIYLSDFSWDCGWYWGGGYLKYHYKNHRGYNTHTHFDSVFLKGASMIDVVRNTFKWSTLTEEEWYRLSDLMIQFYSLKKSAEVFRHGGNYTSKGRNEKELNKDLANTINNHISDVIIEEVYKVLTEGLK